MSFVNLEAAGAAACAAAFSYVNRSLTGGVRGMGEVAELNIVFAGKNITVYSDGDYLLHDLQSASLTEICEAYAALSRNAVAKELSDYMARPVLAAPSFVPYEPPIIDTYEDNCGIEWIVRSDATWRTSTGKDDSADFKPHWNEPTVWSRWLVDKHTRAKKAQERN